MTSRKAALLSLIALAGSIGSCQRADAAALARAPSSPPLSSGQAGTEETAGGEEGTGATPQAEADPLVSNGLGSPSCKGALAGELSATGRSNCETSGFAAAPAPTGDYGIDVHIDTGLLSASSWGSTIAQDMFVTPLWMALVWAVHALVVMLEWSFTVDVLDSAAAAGVGRGLRQMQATLTEPWLPVALAVASVLALYHGLIRRRVADTLGEALLMGAMMVGGIWVVTDPTGTVGALGQWANQASLGTLAVAAQGAPSAPGRALGNSLDTVFVTAIEVPWCFLEFGDVGWCREPSRLDPRLRAAGLKIAAQELAQRSCEPGVDALVPCVPATGAQAGALEHSAELLHAAQTNGALFLALPANGPARNSINEQGSLLRTLCQSSEATSCRGPTAAQAEFRTAGGTLWRIGGVVLIAAGLLGMLLLLGFVAVRLLTAAVFSLLYLLLAPAMVLAPAFGEGGRALFRRWVARLLGAVVAKLVFSFLLGIVLAVISILSDLVALGWWTQWLLMSAFWWGAYANRKQVLGVAEGAFAQQRSGGERASRRSLLKRAREVVEGNQLIAAARWAKDRHAKPAPDVEHRSRQKLAQARDERVQSNADEQARRTLAGEHHDASAGADGALSRRVSGKRARLERLQREHGVALASGDTRRAVKLWQRAERVSTEIEREQGTLNRARELASEGARAQRRKADEPYTAERLREQSRFLDAQAELPSAARAKGAGERRDYAALSGLAGYRREQYERMDPRAQRAARLEIDRELASRREHMRDSGHGGHGGHSGPASHSRRPGFDAWGHAGRGAQELSPERIPSSDRSSVMRDAREVAARRKRQLGKDRP